MKNTFIVDDYPRPQFRRKSFINLNGAWDFAFDFEGKGEELGFSKGFTKERDIIVPFAYEAELSGIGSEKRCDDVWYQRHFEYHKTDKRLLLHLEGADYESAVYVNGILVGKEEGAYHRKSFDLTDALKDGDNLLVIHCHDDYSKEKPRGKQRSEDHNYGCWYVDTTGIYKPVWMEEVSPFYLSSLHITPNVDEEEVTLSLFVEGKGFVEANILVSYEGENVTSKKEELHEGENVLSLAIKNPHLWGSLDPHIYDLDITLEKAGEKSDEVKSYFAFRKVYAKNQKVYLNDKPFYQKLILDQGYFLKGKLTADNEEALLQDIKLMMQIGFNGARKHQKIEDERFYYYADMLGYVVWGEMPSMYALTDLSKTRFEKEYKEVLKQLYNHPSIITWVPFNESWGIDDIATNKDTQAFVNHIYDVTKAYDPTRFCISNDGWEHTKSDLITIHDYSQEGPTLIEKFATREKAVTLPYEWRGKKAFVDGYQYEGQPILLTEFGGSAYQNDYGKENKSWGYGEGVKDDDDYLSRLSSLVKATLEIPCFEGYCYTQLSDVEQEVNGLVRENRAYKVKESSLKEIFSLERKE
mgnify:CR=1 FL=1